MTKLEGNPLTRDVFLHYFYIENSETYLIDKLNILHPSITQENISSQNLEVL